MVKALVEAGADPNATTKEGEAVLMLAVESGDYPTLQFLIAHGADVNAKTPGGTSVKGKAKALGNARAVEILRRAGAK